jgi:molybdate-binding protein
MNESVELHPRIVSAKATVKYYRLGREKFDVVCEGDEHPRPILDKFDSLLQRAARMFWK